MLCHSIPNVLLLDDDLTLLDTLKYYLNKKLANQIQIKSFANGKSLFESLNQNTSSCINISDVYLSLINNHESISSALNEIENFAPILIADHNLGTNEKGGEICKQLKKEHHNIEIFLLTGELDYEIANDLHNTKTIDFFIRKDKPDVIACITKHLIQIINKRKTLFNFDGEISIHHNLDILYKIHYSKSLYSLLQNINYKSFAIINESGNLFIKTLENNIVLYDYDNLKGQFIENESDKCRFYQ